MAHSHREENGVTVLELTGKIMGTSEDLALIDMICQLADQDKLHVVLDLSNVDWMNSRGLGVCITMLTTLRNRGGNLVLASPSEKVESFLERCRMFAVFETHASMEEAIASFN